MAEKKQAPLNKLLTIYFYHTRLTRESYEEWKEYKWFFVKFGGTSSIVNK